MCWPTSSVAPDGDGAGRTARPARPVVRTAAADMPRYLLELHHGDGSIATGDYDSPERGYDLGDRFEHRDTGETWVVERIEDAKPPFEAKLVCAPDKYGTRN